MKKNEYFSEKRAKSFVGKKVVNDREFSGVEKYTIGVVSGTYKSEDGYGIMVS